MIFLLALIPATMLSIAGYGALFLSERSVGNLRSAGRVLGFWAFTLAALIAIGGIIGAARAPHFREMRMRAWRMNPPVMAPDRRMQPALQPNAQPGPAPQPGSPPPGSGSSASAPAAGR